MNTHCIVFVVDTIRVLDNTFHNLSADDVVYRLGDLLPLNKVPPLILSILLPMVGDLDVLQHLRLILKTLELRLKLDYIDHHPSYDQNSE